MRHLTVIMALAFAHLGLAQEQSSIKVGEPQFVAKKVTDVFWSNDGRSLAYVTETKQGKAVGVYDLDLGEGKIVAMLGEGATLQQVVWLNLGKKAVMVVETPKNGQSLAISVLDAHELTAKQLWSHNYEPKEGVGVSIEVSPSLPYALVTIAGAKASETWVLIQNAVGLVFSRDIAAAQTQGMGFAGWSKEGTAIFGAGTGSSGAFTLLGAKGGEVTVSQPNAGSSTPVSDKATFEVALELDKNVPKNLLGELSLKLDGRAFFLRMRPNIDVGATVLECVPSNGALRQVRFTGYSDGIPGPEEYPMPWSKPHQLVMGKSKEGTSALWLVKELPRSEVPPEDGQVRAPAALDEPDWGVLISAQADSVWPAPYTRAVAFTWNGALFVRSITYGK